MSYKTTTSEGDGIGEDVGEGVGAIAGKGAGVGIGAGLSSANKLLQEQLPPER